MFRARQYAVFFILIVLLFILSIRLFYLQILNYGTFSDMALEQHNQVVKLEPRRGTIYDRYYEPLAINLDAPSVYIDPRFIRDKERVARVLSEKLGISYDDVLQKASNGKAFAWIKRKIPVEKAQELKELKLPGVYIMIESERNYPNDSMACHIIGFAGVDNTGLEGLELMLNEKLKGEAGFHHMVRDARARPVLDIENESIPPQNGHNVILTIDSVIQYIVEEELKAMVIKHRASAATGIVMDPYTGRILALANYPSYDVNRSKEASRSSMRDDAVTAIYEPGSVFKIVTASAALNEGICGMNDRFFCENGNYAIAGRILHDYHPNAWLDFKNVISKSSNIGTVKIAQKLGSKKLYEYIRKFGFGEKTGVDLPGEVAGICRPPSVWSKSDISTVPMGQGIAVTPIQLACAISAIANGGDLVRPYIIDKITSWEGEILQQTKPVLRRNVLKKETCAKMAEILREVVVTGTGQRANSVEYMTCGKTGTAQMVNPNGGYYANKYNSSFIGFAPKDKPAISVVIIANDPQPVHFGGTVAGPAFKNIVEKVLQYEASNKRFEKVAKIENANKTASAPVKIVPEKVVTEGIVKKAQPAKSVTVEKKKTPETSKGQSASTVKKKTTATAKTAVPAKTVKKTVKTTKEPVKTAKDAKKTTATKPDTNKKNVSGGER